MADSLTLWFGTFTTLLAVINPLEAIPIFLQLTGGQSKDEHRQIARRSCIYATLLLLFFLLFGNLVLRLFDIPLSMVRIVGGIILMKIGFEMFSPNPAGGILPTRGNGSAAREEDIAFVPLAMPIMVGPGAIATVLGMASLVKHSEIALESVAALVAAILLTMGTTFLTLAYAREAVGRIGPKGIDASTRIVGFFVACMGMGLIFHGLIEALRLYGIISVR